MSNFDILDDLLLECIKIITAYTDVVIENSHPNLYYIGTAQNSKFAFFVEGGYGLEKSGLLKPEHVHEFGIHTEDINLILYCEGNTNFTSYVLDNVHKMLKYYLPDISNEKINGSSVSSPVLTLSVVNQPNPSMFFETTSEENLLKKYKNMLIMDAINIAKSALVVFKETTKTEEGNKLWKNRYKILGVAHLMVDLYIPALQYSVPCGSQPDLTIEDFENGIKEIEKRADTSMTSLGGHMSCAQNYIDSYIPNPKTDIGRFNLNQNLDQTKTNHNDIDTSVQQFIIGYNPTKS